MIEWILHRPPHASNPSEIRVAERLKVLEDSPHVWTVIWGFRLGRRQTEPGTKHDLFGGCEVDADEGASGL